MKKRVWISIISVALAVVLGAALGACTSRNAHDTFTVTYVYHNGEENKTATVAEGETATEPATPNREGYRFVHWYETDENQKYNFQTPVSGDLTLNAAWEEDEPDIPEIQTYTVKWTEFKGGFYVGKDGASLPSSAKENSVITFGIDLSPYYTDTAVVNINRKAAKPDAEGYYTVTLTRNTIVEVEGIVEDKTPFEGKGTAESPYLIRTGGQMKLLAEEVNLKNLKYAKAHYRLEADIDFKNYEYTVIGNSTAAKFYGSFDGNGHTLANIRITEPYVETLTDGSNVSKRAFIGVIGMAAVTSTDPESATVSNLSVENLNVDVEEEASVFGGGVVGYGIGASLWNCAVTGNLHVKTNGGYFSFVGGLVGIHQSAMDTASGIPYYANAMYCMSNLNILTEGYANAAGGLVGSLLADGGATAFVINSYARGNVTGAMYTGGIVGQMSAESSVANVYATGDVSAKSTLNDENYAFAGAGGIVGYAENNSVVQNSFATGNYSATAAAGDNYALADGIAGITLKDAALKITSRSLKIHNSYYAQGGYTANYDFTKRDTLENLLGWQVCDWSFDPDDSDYPTVQEDYLPAENVLTLAYGAETVAQKTEKKVALAQDGNAYLPVSYWGAIGEISSELTADAHSDGTVLRTYGLFFDEACTDPVPDAYILAKNEKFWFGWADYTAVAGTYLFGKSGDQASLELTDAGVAYYRHGAIRQTISYTYGGRYGEETTPKIVFRDAYFCSLYSGSANYALTDFIASVENSVIKLRDALYFPEGGELTGYGDNAVIGTWYGEDRTYEFFLDRSCAFDGRAAAYTVAGDTVSVTVDGTVYNGTYTDGSETLTLASDSETLILARVDTLKGVWESEINHNDLSVFEFDGKGGYQSYTYRFESYEDKSNPDKFVVAQRKVKVGETVRGTYVYRDGQIAFDGKTDKTGAFDENGLLKITENAYTEVYGRENGFRGTWVDNWINDGEGYRMTLSGIGKDGTGTMFDSNGFSAIYELDNDEMLTMYVGTVLYGLGNYQANNLASDPRDKKGGMLFCAIYTNSSGMLVDDYNLAHLDRFEGVWTSADDTLGELDFNGFGDYDLRQNTSSGAWIVEGEVGVGGEKVRYYNQTAHSATFEFGGATYTAAFAQGKLNVTDGTNSYAYVRHDRFAEYEWLSADGGRIVFNGKGEIGKGTLVVTAPDGTVGAGTYVADGDTATLTVEGREGTALRNTVTGCLEVTVEGETVVFGVDNDFTGEWAVQGGGLIRIGALSENYRGSGDYVVGGETKPVTFRLATGYALAMIYTDETDASKNVTLYLLLLNGGEMVLSPYYDIVEGTYLVCTRPDELTGEWAGTDATLTFDGIGHSQYTYGVATLTDGDTTQTFYYSDADGAWALYGVTESGAPAARYVVVFGDGADADYTFTRDGATIALYASDGLYGVRVTDEEGNEYRFNGLSAYGKGELTGGAGAYRYSGASVGEDGTVTVELTDAQNRRYVGTVVADTDAEGNPVNIITITPCESAAA